LSEAPAGLGRVTARYEARAASGEIARDPAQLALARRLDHLNGELAERRLAAKGSALGWLFAARTPPVKGLYIYGDVGRGKTFLMDAFFTVAAPRRKRRAHFHEFMGDVHQRIHAFRQAVKNGATKGDDPIGPVAAGIAEECRLLCLDEFFVRDIADAMILSRLFGQLFERGLVLVATSNTAPDDLYRDGLNRALFLPFVAVLKRHADIVGLNGATDYRMEKLGRMPVYVTPLGPEADATLDRIWRHLTGSDRGQPASLTVTGRELRVPEAAKGVARFSFAELCETPLGAGDYLRIAHTFHTVIVDGIPVIRDGARDAARRFINLIDTLYDHRVKLVASAAAEPAGLYRASEGEEALAFRRTVSRLTEMRSEEYLSAPRRAVAPTG